MSGFSNARQTGGSIAIKDEGVTLTTAASSIDFAGAGVAGSIIGAAVTETISGGPGTIVYNETPTGSVDGNNVTFTLAHTPSPAASLHLVLNGATQTPGGVDFTLSGSTITMVNPPLGTLIAKFYTY